MLRFIFLAFAVGFVGLFSCQPLLPSQETATSDAHETLTNQEVGPPHERPTSQEFSHQELTQEGRQEPPQEPTAPRPESVASESIPSEPTLEWIATEKAPDLAEPSTSQESLEPQETPESGEQTRPPEPTIDRREDAGSQEQAAPDLARPEPVRETTPTREEAPESQACPVSQRMCAGSCVDTDNNSRHCGSCNQICPAGQICQMAQCRCPVGQAMCNGACVNTATNAQHCGSCNAFCTTGQTCQNGSCQCPPGSCGGLGLLSDEFAGTALSGWNLLNPTSATLHVSGGSLHITPNRSLWFNATATGIFVSKDVTGDFIATAYVVARRASDASLPPTTPFRLGGIMARNPSTAQGQNYVFLVVGADDSDLSVEHKTTVNSSSTYAGPTWALGEGELRICRLGSAFRLYVRSRNGTWQMQTNFTRTDLPATLQVGPVAYANASPPDLRVSYEYVRFDSAATLADCTR